MVVSIKKTIFNHVHFLGAAGIGMSALIKIIQEKQFLGLLDSEIKISQSDLAWRESNTKANDPLSDDIDLVVATTAIPKDDPELAELQKRGVEIWHRSDMLAYLASSCKQIVVSGTHGKTSCSAMVAHIMSHAGLDPSFAIGGVLANYDTNGKAGSGEYFVLEGDESDKSFMKTNPHFALVTSVEPDHLENYPGGLNEIRECFTKFLSSASKSIICIDEPNAREIFFNLKEKYQSENNIEQQIYSYSIKSKDADFYLDLKSKKFFVGEAIAMFVGINVDNNRGYGPIELTLPGEYNLSNALGAIAVASMAGVTFEKAIAALKDFRGIQRRFELINSEYVAKSGAKVKVYDDYAHHPTEVRALVEAALSTNPQRLVLVYQPHHPRRTQDLWDRFKEVFEEFPEDHLLLLADIYVARTGHIEGVSSKKLAREISNPAVKYLDLGASDVALDVQANYRDIDKLMKPIIEQELRDGDLLMIVGAGNITKVAKAFV